jgi:rhodanese-related sulfurtransferase
MHTPGHTRDSLCLILPDRILTGDTLFLDEGGAGRDDLPGGDAAIHWESLQRLKELHDNVIVFPGHDYRNRRPSTIREQKQRNPFFKPRSQADYIRFVEELKLGPSDWMKEVLKANVHCTRDRGGLHIPADVSACEAQGTLPCSDGQVEPAQVSAHQLRSRLDAKENLVLLDVREQAELSEELGHITGIIHIPVGTVVQRLLELKPHAEREIVVICKMGGRARSAAKILQSEGFPSVTVLSGGMIAWNNAGLPVQRSWSALPVSSPSPVSG